MLGCLRLGLPCRYLLRAYMVDVGMGAGVCGMVKDPNRFVGSLVRVIGPFTLFTLAVYLLVYLGADIFGADTSSVDSGLSNPVGSLSEGGRSREDNNPGTAPVVEGSKLPG